MSLLDIMMVYKFAGLSWCRLIIYDMKISWFCWHNQCLLFIMFRMVASFWYNTTLRSGTDFKRMTMIWILSNLRWSCFIIMDLCANMDFWPIRCPLVFLVLASHEFGRWQELHADLMFHINFKAQNLNVYRLLHLHSVFLRTW